MDNISNSTTPSLSKDNNTYAMKNSGLKTIELNYQKAGMIGLDKDHINKIIYNISKGSPYFQYQQKRQERIDKRVQEMKCHLETISSSEKETARRKMDLLASKLEEERDSSHVIVHFDMDAFYAAVEIRDNPELKNKPVAVGSSHMLSTSNYHARKYGVRAAMPGFIAKKLCPNLVIVPLNFDKYTKVSQEVFNVFKNYDPNFLPMSLDEAYIDLSEYLCSNYKLTSEQKEKWCWTGTEESISVGQIIDEVVKEIRQKIFEVTQLTASAGIAPNMMLAKICSDKNKPNGQFRIPSDAEERKMFVSNLLVRKISGIGPVQEQMLNSLEIKTCQDLWENRDVIAILFSPTCMQFYMRVALGLGCTELKNDSQRKSKSVETTFSPISSPQDLYEKCQELCKELSQDLKASHIKGKVVVLKIKTVSFDVHTKHTSLNFYTSEWETIYLNAKKLIDSEIAACHPHLLQLRLMGVRMCNLIDESMEQKQRHQQTVLHSLKNCSKTNNTSASNMTAMCPVCSQSQSVNRINSHLDECLNQKDESNTKYTCLLESNEESSKCGRDVENKEHNEFDIENINKFTKYSNTDFYLEDKDDFNGDKQTCVNDNESFSDINEPEKELNTQNDENADDCYMPNNSIQTLNNGNEIENYETVNDTLTCPVCGNQKSENLQRLNQHIDLCLNKLTVRELLSQSETCNSSEKRKQTMSPSSSHSAKKQKSKEQSCRKIEEFFNVSKSN